MSIEYISGTVAAITDKQTAQGKPKLVLELTTEGNRFPTRINFSGRDLEALAAVKVGQIVKVGFEYLEIPSGPHAGTKMRMGRIVEQMQVAPPTEQAKAGVQQAPGTAISTHVGQTAHLAYIIAYEAILKAVAVPGESAQANHGRVLEQYDLMDGWAQARVVLDGSAKGTAEGHTSGGAEAQGADDFTPPAGRPEEEECPI